MPHVDKCRACEYCAVICAKTICLFTVLVHNGGRDYGRPRPRTVEDSLWSWMGPDCRLRLCWLRLRQSEMWTGNCASAGGRGPGTEVTQGAAQTPAQYRSRHRTQYRDDRQSSGAGLWLPQTRGQRLHRKYLWGGNDFVVNKRKCHHSLSNFSLINGLRIRFWFFIYRGLGGHLSETWSMWLFIL